MRAHGRLVFSSSWSRVKQAEELDVDWQFWAAVPPTGLQGKFR